jgi:lycopene elongase/hydratase (dihydrobisanhydrobacterioruberin-forming)
VAAVTLPTRRGLWPSLYWVHRLEYPFSIFYLCQAVWGASWAVANPRQLLTAPVLAIVVANLSHQVGEVVLNAALDVDADVRNPQKRQVASASQRLGRRALLGLATAELALPVLIAGAVSMALSRPSIVVWMAIIVALQALYNLEPVRLKRRGMANPVTLALTYSVLPALPVYLAVRPDVTPSTWLVLLGMLFAVTGRTLWWALPDRRADVEANDSTPVVRLGVPRSLLVACLLSAVGVALIGVSLWWRYGPVWALVGMASASLFLVVQLRQLGRVSEAGVFRAVRMRRRDLPLALAADLAVAVIPLAALAL